MYMATSDDEHVLNGYRTAGLFHNKLMQAVQTIKTSPNITLRGRLPLYVDLHVDDYFRPRGWLSYRDYDTPLEDADRSTITCYRIPGTEPRGNLAVSKGVSGLT